MRNDEMIAIMNRYGFVTGERSNSSGSTYWKLVNVHNVTIRGLLTSNKDDAIITLYTALNDWMWNTVNDPTLTSI